jgi:hypothetical protein
MIKLKNLILENSGDAKILYVKDKDGKYVITPKTLTNFMDKHKIKGVNPEIAKRFIKTFDYNAFNQFASDNPNSNIKNDSKIILADYQDMYGRW